MTQSEAQQLSRQVLRNFSWLVENQLAGVAYPASEEALAVLKALGIRAFLSLSEQPLPAHLLTRLELEAYHLPMIAAAAPSMHEIERALAAIDTFLKRGLPVAVHCHLGIGRTGTVLACYLVRQGATARQAIMQVRAARPGSIDMLGQEIAIYWYERYSHQEAG